MNEYLIQENTLIDIANSIRSKTGTAEQLAVSNFSSAINAIQTTDNPTVEPIITEYVYTYDGDTNSTDHTWITNYGDIKVFAKMGEIPKGELNLVGATLFRTNPNNEWLNKTVTITEEHLTKVLNKASTDIPAV